MTSGPDREGAEAAAGQLAVVVVNHCHPELPHVCAVRLRHFAEALARRPARIEPARRQAQVGNLELGILRRDLQAFAGHEPAIEPQVDMVTLEGEAQRHRSIGRAIARGQGHVDRKLFPAKCELELGFDGAVAVLRDFAGDVFQALVRPAFGSDDGGDVVQIKRLEIEAGERGDDRLHGRGKRRCGRAGGLGFGMADGELGVIENEVGAIAGQKSQQPGAAALAAAGVGKRYRAALENDARIAQQRDRPRECDAVARGGADLSARARIAVGPGEQQRDHQSNEDKGT